MTEKVYSTALDRQNELENCRFAKTILMLLVVLYHSMVFWTGNWFCDLPALHAPILSFVAKWLDSFHIYAFTLISGYVFYHLQCENERHYATYGTLVKAKVRRLLVPYTFVSIIWVIPISMIFFHYTIKDLMLKYVLAIEPSQLWFLFMLFDVFVLFYPLTSAIKKEPTGYLIIGGGYLIGLLGERYLPNIFQIWTAFRYLAYFGIGFKIRQHGSSLLRKAPLWFWLLSDLFGFFISQAMAEYDGIIIKLFNFTSRNFINLWGAVALFVILQMVANHLNRKRSKWILGLQRMSMPIYLFHQQIIYFTIRFLNGRVNPVCHMLINFIAAIVLSSAIAGVLLRSKTTRFLIGEK